NLEPPFLAVSKLGDWRVGSSCEIYELERVVYLIEKARDLSRILEQIELELAAQLSECRDCQVFAHSQAIEQLVDLVTLGQAQLADIGYCLTRDVLLLEHNLPGGR